MKPGITITPAWAAVALTVAGMASSALLWTGRAMFAPKADYATKSDVDSLRWEVRGMGKKIDIMLMQSPQSPQARRGK